MRSATIIRGLGAAVLFVGMTACHDPASVEPPDVSTLSLSSVDGIIDVRASRVDQPPRPRDFDTDDAALDRELAGVGDTAYVSFKAPGSRSMRETGGIRAAVRAEQARGALAELRAHGVQVLDIYGALGMARVIIPRGAAGKLRHNPYVDFIEPTPRRRPVDEGLVSVPSGGQPALLGSTMMAQTTPWDISFVQAPAAWSYTTGSGSAKLMIIGYGMNPNPDNPTLPNGNCVGLPSACSSGIEDDRMMMGIMTARNNTIGVVGVAPGIPGSSVFEWRVGYDNGAIDHNQYVSAINNAVYYGVKTIFINMTFTTYWEVEATAINAAWGSGVMVVTGVGSGNIDATGIVWPASVGVAVAVSGMKPDSTFATGVAGCQAPSSNYGGLVDFSAPYWAYTTIGGGYGDTKSFFQFCSTRIAAAHVAGAIHLLRSYRPTWIPGAIYAALMNSASIGPNLNPYQGHGIPNAGASMTAQGNTLVVHIDGPATVPVGATCGYHATASGGVEPYNFEWFVDGVSEQPSGDWFDWATWAPYTLNTIATDMQNQNGTYTIYVNTDSGMQFCP